MNNKVFLFDFDGTLYSGDAFGLLFDFIQQNKRKFLPRLSDTQYKNITKEFEAWQNIYFDADIINAICTLKKKNPQLQIYEKDFLYWHKTVIEPIVIDKKQIVDIKFLQGLCKNYPVYIVSNSSQLHIKHYLNYMGIDYKIFRKIVSNNYTKRDRTKKHYYKAIMEKEHCQPKDCHVFGDSVQNDLVPAQKLGMNTHYVTDATKIKDMVKEIIKG